MPGVDVHRLDGSNEPVRSLLGFTPKGEGHNGVLRPVSRVGWPLRSDMHVVPPSGTDRMYSYMGEIPSLPLAGLVHALTVDVSQPESCWRRRDLRAHLRALIMFRPPDNSGAVVSA